jgi:hypothetical protein
MQPILAACERYYDKRKKDFSDEERLVLEALTDLYKDRPLPLEVSENPLLLQQLRDIKGAIMLPR